MNEIANRRVTGRETLVFRDGKPFGMDGALTGGHMAWPMPSTLAGMVRSLVGQETPGYFDRTDKSAYDRNVARLRTIGVRSLPLHRPHGRDEFLPLFPAPADAAITSGGEKLRVERYSCQSLTDTNEGCLDLPRDWLLPFAPRADKPASRRPAFWHCDIFCAWLKEESFAPALSRHELGVDGATPDTRFHTAIDPATGTVLEGALFDTPGIRLASKRDELAIGLYIDGLAATARALGAAYLGGERRVVRCEPSATSFPAMPTDLIPAGEPQRFLRLILTSPGSFRSNWAPDWLLPNFTQAPEPPPPPSHLGEGWIRRLFGRRTNAGPEWRKVLDTPHRVRLRSAWVPGWTPLSGWDYATTQPKKMSKIVPAGAVYLIELEKPDEAHAFASAIWGRSLADDPQEQADGFGVAVVGRAQEIVSTNT